MSVTRVCIPLLLCRFLNVAEQSMFLLELRLGCSSTQTLYRCNMSPAQHDRSLRQLQQEIAHRPIEKCHLHAIGHARALASFSLLDIERHCK